MHTREQRTAHKHPVSHFPPSPYGAAVMFESRAGVEYPAIKSKDDKAEDEPAVTGDANPDDADDEASFEIT